MFQTYFLVFTMWLAHLTVDFMIGFFSIFKTIEHLDLAKAGLIAGVSALAGEGMQILFGSLSDRGYRKALILLGIFLTGSSALLPYFDSYSYYFLIYFLTCVGSGAFHPSAAGLVGKLKHHRKSLLMSIFASGGFLGLAISQMTFREAYAYFNKDVFWLGVPVLAVVFCLFFQKLPENSLTRSTHFTPSNLLKIFQFFKVKEMRLLYFIQVCNQTILWGTMFLLPDVLSARGYEPWIAFGAGHLFFVLGAGLLLAPAGLLIDKFSSKNVLLTGFILGVVLFYLFLGIYNIPPQLLLPLLFLLGATVGILNPVCVAYGTRLFPENPGMASAFLMGLVWCVSEVIGPTGGGFLTTFFTDDAPAYALGILGSMFLIGIGFTYLLPQEEKEEVPVITG